MIRLFICVYSEIPRVRQFWCSGGVSHPFCANLTRFGLTIATEWGMKRHKGISAVLSRIALEKGKIFSSFPDNSVKLTISESMDSGFGYIVR